MHLALTRVLSELWQLCKLQLAIAIILCMHRTTACVANITYASVPLKCYSSRCVAGTARYCDYQAINTMYNICDLHGGASIYCRILAALYDSVRINRERTQSRILNSNENHTCSLYFLYSIEILLLYSSCICIG